MARAIERIERDIALLQEAIDAIAAELYSAYASYLVVLGQAVRQQLILASYHLCTQGYPQNFLKLSLNQKQQLQQAIRKLGHRAVEELLIAIRSEEDEEDEEDEESVDANSLLGVNEVLGVASPAEDHHPITSETEQLAWSEVEMSESQSFQSLTSPDLSSPIELVAWQQNLEAKMQSILKKVSRDANTVFQKARILPQKLPEPILEAAAAAAAAVSEASAEVIPGPPNLLNLVIEIENEQDEQDSGVTQIMAINLRLGEIEFADATLASRRKQIRSILNQLNKVGREYQKKQRERSIAEAEAAWRSVWSDD
jgi:hypothetical protein